MTNSKVSVIGLGRMGRALAGALVEDGHPTTVWNRSPARAGDLVATRAASVADAVAASPVTLVCVSPDYDLVREILDPAPLAGRAIVNLTSGTPEQARATAAWATERGAQYLDGAIMAIPPQIGGAETLIFYGGSRTAFDDHRAALTSLGGRTTYLGDDAGLPALYDLALLSMMWATCSGFLHGLALVGDELPAFLPYAADWLTDVVSFTPRMGEEAMEGDYATDISTVDINKVGVDLLVGVSRERGIGIDVPAATQALLDRRVADGHGADSFSSLIEVIRRPA